MFGIGSTELLVILIVALVVLGPKSLPGIAKTVGKVMGEFRRVSTEFQRTMNAEVANDEHEKRKKEAEEELFGKETASATTKGTPAQGPTVGNDVVSDASTAKESPVVETTAATITTAAQEQSPASPLEAAVAKAEAEAASVDVAAPMTQELPLTGTEPMKDKA